MMDERPLGTAQIVGCFEINVKGAVNGSLILVKNVG